MTVAQLAQQAETSQGYISDIENGKRRLSDTMARKIALAAGMRPEQFEAVLVELAPKFMPPFEYSFEAQTKLQEDAAIYRTRTTPADLEQLGRWWAESLNNDEIRKLIHKFTDEALQGSARSGACARALLEILQQKDR
jgi:transcriptional regulator with XRE-family HTH domain